ncbi:sensor histidine kinase [Streptomyces sp. CB03238]|uniref:sensor histidine kinase n=1 Tax=Streptomyces sp. CB03238 TaxID=1907777 RepID=UPI001F4E7E92|nr:sensor histidine kinase [Streptomyces sp. CB03238]
MRLRTLLILLALVPTVAMGTQVAVTADRLLAQSGHLRSDVAAGERLGIPLHTLMVELQTERTMTAARWAGSAVSEDAVRAQRAATDAAAEEFRRSSASAGAGSEEADRRLLEVMKGLADLDTYRERADARIGSADSVIVFYSDLISQTIRYFQDGFSHTDDAGLTQESRVVITMFSAAEMLAQEDTILALAGPSRELSTRRFADFVNAVGAHRHLYDRWVVPFLPTEDGDRYSGIAGSDAWQTKTRIENEILSDHKDTDSSVKLPRGIRDWSAAHKKWSAEVDALNMDRTRALLANGDARASELEAEVTWLIAGSSGALLIVAVAIVFTTRSVLRRLRVLHERTVTIAEETLPDVVARLQQGQPVDAEALPAVGGEQDEVGRVSDAFARVVAVSVDGHRQLAAERHGFGMFAAGIASRTGNLVSRQLTLTEELQDTFGGDEALLAQLMRSDQLTVGMRRQIENLLILAGGEIPDPHTEPMRVADLLREAAAEVEDFRRIERQALDEISVEPRVISQISHLLAELLDNATRFSPPRSKVVIRAELVADGLSVEIEDRGPRVTPATYEEMNRRLHSAPPYSVLAENAHRLGLFVVGHLADQLGATVTLRRSVYGGTSAVVIVPRELLVPTEREREPVGVTARPTPAVDRPEPEPEPESGPGREPHRSDEGRPELVLHVAADPLPLRQATDRQAPVEHARDPQEPATPASDRPAPAQPGTRDGAARPTPPALPERVPQSHMARQLREPRTTDTTVTPDTATPQEVADAWDDYEQGTRTVEIELRQDQP